jgi:hypothetical protein
LFFQLFLLLSLPKHHAIVNLTKEGELEAREEKNGGYAEDVTSWAGFQIPAISLSVCFSYVPLRERVVYGLLPCARINHM